VSRLRELRRQAGLTQTSLAAELEVTTSAISHFETGRHAPSTSTTRRIAEVLAPRLNRTVRDVAGELVVDSGSSAQTVGEAA